MSLKSMNKFVIVSILCIIKINDRKADNTMNDDDTILEVCSNDFADKFIDEFKKRFVDVKSENFDTQLAFNELMNDYREYFNKYVDPDRKFYNLVLQHLKACQIDITDVEVMNIFLKSMNL